ncbi:ATP-grasp domain-containing protein [archaeon]|nr:MAG: ATP-grasp domain-containing protein [archaeon]
MRQLQDLPFDLIAVLPGAETGVELADQLSSRLGLRSNGTQQSIARRNKYVMGETVRAAGVRAVKQAKCVNEDEVIAFLETLKTPGSDSLRCVVKPVQSAGTDDVFLCQNEEEALTAFNRIYGKMNGIGLMNECVLVQEFLVGKEYVVDKVSRDGVHKLVCIWEYDKRKVNGANFVYFGMRLKASDTPMAKVLTAYSDKVLDALGIKQGPSHMEVMVNTITKPDGSLEYQPCLVEVGARCHGGEGTWLPVVQECVGYSMVGVTLDAYLQGELFNKIDKDHFPLKKAGREVDMVSRYGGIVRSLPGEEAIRKLPSFRSMSWEVKPGDYAHKTIDCFTRPGCVQLVADTEEDAERDLEAIHSLEVIGLIDYAVICPKPPSIGAVVVVDPFSTGANIAATVLKWGYKLILIFSEKDSPVAKLVAKGAHVKPTLLIQHDNRNPNQDAAIQETLLALEAENSPILAILPGAETGVELAEVLASRYGTRHNTPDMTESHRNKFVMQETIRRAGVRAIHQQLCRSEVEVKDFVQDLFGAKQQGKCVIKPNLSAGTDHVFLCHNEAEALEAFSSIHGQINGLGHVNDGMRPY